MPGLALMHALPLGLAPLSPPLGGTIWDHPVLADIAFAEDIAGMRARERQREVAAAATWAARRNALERRVEGDARDRHANKGHSALPQTPENRDAMSGKAFAADPKSSNAVAPLASAARLPLALLCDNTVPSASASRSKLRLLRLHRAGSAESVAGDTGSTENRRNCAGATATEKEIGAASDRPVDERTAPPLAIVASPEHSAPGACDPATPLGFATLRRLGRGLSCLEASMQVVSTSAGASAAGSEAPGAAGSSAGAVAFPERQGTSEHIAIAPRKVTAGHAPSAENSPHTGGTPAHQAARSPSCETGQHPASRCIIDTSASTSPDAADHAQARKQSCGHVRTAGAGLRATDMPRATPRHFAVPPSAAVAVPLCWAAGARSDGFANLGDALSAVVVAALSGLPVRHMAARSPVERLAAVGTIGHSLKGGHVHLWGSGLDATLHPERDGPWSPPRDTRFTVHATRGPETAATLRRHGIPAPETFGDPVHLLPRLWPLDHVARDYELGIVLHLSELDEKSPRGRARPDYLRYQVPESLAGSVRLINMYADSSLAAFEAKIAEIVACKRILSTSLHGLVIADAYGIPSAWFSFFGHGLTMIDLLDPTSRIDHRMRDLYGAFDWHEAPVFATPRHQPTDFDAAIKAIDEAVHPSGFDPSPLIEAFPGPLGVDPDSARWPLPQCELDGVIL
ncbi:MAG: polysaccharide pyruvyl transferase family protein [Pseudomonadota bacterium]